MIKQWLLFVRNYFILNTMRLAIHLKYNGKSWMASEFRRRRASCAHSIAIDRWINRNKNLVQQHVLILDFAKEISQQIKLISQFRSKHIWELQFTIINFSQHKIQNWSNIWSNECAMCLCGICIEVTKGQWILVQFHLLKIMN